MVRSASKHFLNCVGVDEMSFGQMGFDQMTCSHQFTDCKIFSFNCDQKRKGERKSKEERERERERQRERERVGKREREREREREKERDKGREKE
jgi:hypothetical protein